MPKTKPIWVTILSCLLLFSCRSQSPALTETDPTLNDSITSYLEEQVGISGFEGEIFCAFDYLVSPQGAADRIYVWALCQEYYLEKDSISEGSGVSLPVALQIQAEDGLTQIIGFQIPGDGSSYGPDVKEIFPTSAWRKILPANKNELNQYNERASDLLGTTHMMASEYFSNGN